MSAPDFVAGLDLGQKQDFTGLVVVERTYHPDPLKLGQSEPHFAVRHIHRWPLLTSYPAIVSDLTEMFGRPELRGSDLVVDGTGVGVAVVDLITTARLPARVHAYTITGGERAGMTNTVPKKNLVGAVQVALESRRLKVAAGLELAATLAAELEAYRVKVTATRNEVFEGWRERDHDDLVLALALAVWFGSWPRLGGPTVVLDPVVPVGPFPGMNWLPDDGPARWNLFGLGRR